MNITRLWITIKKEAELQIKSEPSLSLLLHKAILNAKNFQESLSIILSNKLANNTVDEMSMLKIIQSVFEQDVQIVESAGIDLQATKSRDPAIDKYSIPLLFLKGYHALQSYRVAHYLWMQKRTYLALYLQSTISQSFNVDIHPAAYIGRGILIDHATSLVIGETAVIEDNVSLLHEVTLGGTGKDHIDRHPKVRAGALIGAGAKILGNIEIGMCSKIGAGSVVLDNVPPHTTVVGVPAKIVGKVSENTPSTKMNHIIRACD